MTGISNFNLIRLLSFQSSIAVSAVSVAGLPACRLRKLLAAIALVATTAPASAADISFTGGGKLTGEVTAINSAGTITLDSPIALKPLRIDGAQVKLVDFGKSSTVLAVPDQRVELINGDILPAQVDELDSTSIRISSDSLGEISVPRKMVESLQLGIVPEHFVYRSKDSQQGWNAIPGTGNAWEMEDGKFIANGQGMISKDLSLPEKYILRFTLGWSNHPNFRIFFSDPLKTPQKRVDRYFLQFAGSGVEIRRESTGKNRYSPIVLLNRPPELFPRKNMKVELRVDRSRGLLHVYLDGELEGRYTDPIEAIPQGGGVAFFSQAPRESEQTVSDLEVLVWDDRGDRHKTEDRGDRSTDSLIGRFGERFGGSLKEVRTSDAGQVYVFKSDFQTDPIELPESEVSTVFFSGKEREGTIGETEGIILRLRGGGQMLVTSCEFVGTKVNVVHPLLGKMEIGREGITSLEKRSIPKAEPVKSR